MQFEFITAFIAIHVNYHSSHYTFPHISLHIISHHALHYFRAHQLSSHTIHHHTTPHLFTIHKLKLAHQWSHHTQIVSQLHDQYSRQSPTPDPRPDCDATTGNLLIQQRISQKKSHITRRKSLVVLKNPVALYFNRLVCLSRGSNFPPPL
jgi:hypothetical protein